MFKYCFSFVGFLSLTTLVTGCYLHRECDNIVCQTYVHRYGVHLDQQDWSARGKHGQVISLRKDGVTMTQSYDSGILEGECSYTFPYRNHIHRTEFYQQGKLIEETYHYMSGLPQQRIIYNDPHYSLTTRYENGSPQSKEEWRDGKIIEGEYYNLLNQVESQIDQGNGLRTKRNDLDAIEYVDSIQNGEMVQRTTYHSNGAPAAAIDYKNGQIEGERRTYLPNGAPLAIETWQNNCQQGCTIEYEYGEKVAEVPYVRGQKQGVEKRFRDNGKILVQEITWVKGKKQGPCYSYIGNKKQIEWYFANRLVNKQTYNMLMNQ